MEIHSDTHSCKDHDTEYDTVMFFLKPTASKTHKHLRIHNEFFK